MFGGHWCACVIVFWGHCVWGKCSVSICRCHMYRFQLTGLGWLLLLLSLRRRSNLLWSLRLTASWFYLCLPETGHVHICLSRLHFFCTCYIHFPIRWCECVVLWLESGVSAMLSPCSARLHFSLKSSDVQVLFFGGHKAFNGSTVFPIYFGCCFYYEDFVYLLCVCTWGSEDSL